MPILASPVYISSPNQNFKLNRKLPLIHPIHKNTAFQYSHPQYFKKDGEKWVEVDTEIINQKYLRIQNPTSCSEEHQLFAVCDIELDSTIVLGSVAKLDMRDMHTDMRVFATLVLALVPNIFHSLYRNGKENIELSSQISLSRADKNKNVKKCKKVSACLPWA